MKKNNFGFTLVELMVSIVIIAILATFTYSSFSGTQKQARDSQRKNDLNQYKVALENYSSANNGYYLGLVSDNPYPITTANLCVNTTLYNFLNNTCLYDPKDDLSAHTTDCTENNYYYCYSEDGATLTASALSYFLTAKLETGGFWVVCSNGKQGKVADGAFPTGVTCPL